MKLGDNMTTVEGCKIWSDVCPRKTRPPRIGDIPKHVAIDEESPSSSSHLLVTPLEVTKPGHGTVNSTLLSVKEKLSSTIGSLEPNKIVIDNNDNDNDNDNDVSERITNVNISEKNQQEEKCYQLRDNYRQQSKSSLSADTAEEFDEINWDTRKDSAVCLDDTDELDQLKERLLVQKVIRSDSPSRNLSPDNTTTSCSRLSLSFLSNQRIPAVYATCKNSEELSEVQKDCINNPSLAKYYRPRRESSGYSSNLSTFDEDRRNSTTIEAFQGFNSGAQRERRRSSTAKRFNLNRFASTKEEESERMPTSEVIYRKVSTAGLIEMPDIKELKEISEDVKCSSPDDELVCLSTSGLDILTAKKPEDKESLKFTQKTSIYNKDHETDATKDVLVNDTRDCVNASAIVTERSDKRNIQEIHGILGQTSLSTDSYKEISTAMSKDICQSSISDDSLNVLSGTRNDKLIKNYQETCCQKREEKRNSEFENPVPGNSPALKLNEKMNDKVGSISKVSSRSQSCNIVDESLRKPLKGLTSSPNSSPKSSRHRSRIIHQYSSPLSSTMELESISEKPQDDSYAGKNLTVVVDNDDDDDDDDDDDEGDNICDDDDRDVFVARRRANRIKKLNETEQLDTKKLFPRSVKVYQLLSTQSEDREDGEPRFMDRRTSLQINRQDVEEETIPRTALCIPDDKKLLHAESVPLIKIPGPVEETCVENDSLKIGRLSPVGKLSSTAVNVNQKPGDSGAVGIRPIYPYCPYSPYGSPQGSPRIRRRPLRESRRVSIDNKQGALQLNQYKLLDNIGQGSFGIVKLAFNEEDDTHYAMKILSKKKLMKKAGIFGRMAPGRKGVSNPLAKVYREIALLKKLDHPNVVKLVEVLDDPDEDNLYLVFELVERGEVLELPTDKPLDEETARIHFRDVVLGVEYLHYQKIVHRDIKPSNLLVDSEGRVKIADLGVSAELRASGELLSGSAGTPAFAAPETTVPGAQYSGTLCDVWSMGVTLYTLVIGRVPWDGSGSIIGVQAAVRTEPLRFPDSPVLTDDLRDLIIRMLTKDPAMRASLQEIKTHRWLTNYGKEPLPSEADNCRLPVTVTDEEVARVVTRVPKLDTLILIKTMLKQHSFQNPFLPKRVVRPACRDSDPMSGNLKLASTGDDSDVTTSREVAKSKTQQFHRAGRSNSAPDSFEWQTSGRQVSIDTPLSPVTEASIQETEIIKR
ncbi:probable myosin light chain kinase DDB_G0279831 [Microplitis mediator]|uniref:probable myosin light chain kinase DDB_G0279831 n=1 Tax=Microplitis mediator TaxID=375433 RepID=UPI002553D73D|nr:probable myosin light chain kinase DDB_G0279831 [Microplitis mediator]